jgi:hypothetical protein
VDESPDVAPSIFYGLFYAEKTARSPRLPAQLLCSHECFCKPS